MCILCYLSTDRVIEDIPFDENDRKFNIQRTEERPPCLTKQFVYYCGSSMCCGCGFGDRNVTEEILQRTDLELQAGKLTEETQWLWWNQGEPPPENKEEFAETAGEIRESHRDTIALYRLIEETCKSGFDCELLVCWADLTNEEPNKIFLVHAGQEQINVDFRSAHDEVLLYRFPASQG